RRMPGKSLFGATLRAWSLRRSSFRRSPRPPSASRPTPGSEPTTRGGSLPFSKARGGGERQGRWMAAGGSSEKWRHVSVLDVGASCVIVLKSLKNDHDNDRCDALYT